MAARTPTVLPVPSADRAIDRHGRVWHCWQISTDPYASYWETSDRVGANWATLQNPRHGHGPVLAYRSDEWAVA